MIKHVISIKWRSSVIEDVLRAEGTERLRVSSLNL